MHLQNIDKAAFKTIFKEILRDDPLFREEIRQILADDQVDTSKKQVQRQELIEKMIDDNFDKYDEVFKALA